MVRPQRLFQWIVSKRYNDIFNYAQSLRKKFGSLVPDDFPAKTYFASSVVIEERCDINLFVDAKRTLSRPSLTPSPFSTSRCHPSFLCQCQLKSS